MFTIYETHLFLSDKTEKFKIAVFFSTAYPCIYDVAFFKQENCY